MKAKIWCECTCSVCGGVSAESHHYRGKKSIEALENATKDWIWRDEVGNICPECQESGEWKK